MKAKFIIRRACIKDIENILKVENESFGSDMFSRSQFTYLINKSKGAFYIAVIDSNIAGYMCLLSHSMHKNIRIYSIAVLSEYRSIGIAGAFISKAKEIAVSENKIGISLEVRKDNLPAIKLYKKNGFHISSVKMQYYNDLTSAYYMQLAI
ncbi:MAG: GNAT family N-acetyltransferase [Bacteroidales bacterium]|jgi:ribosomal protein S18 acetylase RimI-like enzyme|nr:GNAT family N-acetyltransferase [Bacteroidales bacterium]